MAVHGDDYVSIGANYAVAPGWLELWTESMSPAVSGISVWADRS